MCAVHCRHSGTSTHRNVNDTPDTTFAVPLEDGTDVLGIDEVNLVSIDHGRFLILFRRIGRQSIARNLAQTIVDSRVRVVEVIDRDNFETTSLLKDMDDVRACRAQYGQRSPVVGSETEDTPM